MKIDLSCPVELWRTTLPQPDTHAAELILYNLSEKIVTSVEITMLLMDADGEEVERVIHRAHDLDGRPASAFAVIIPMERREGTEKADITIGKVWFDDNSVWRHQRENMVTYTSNALPSSRSLEQLRFVAGGDAVGYPEKKDGLWLCVCGRPNGLNERACRRCHRTKDEVFARFTKEAVQSAVQQREAQLNLHARAAREDSSRLQLEREKAFEHKKKKQRTARIVLIALLVAALAAYGTWFHLIPFLRYRAAESAVADGRYSEAITAFEKLGDYPGAAEGISRSRYLSALASFEGQDQDALLEARETLLALGDYEDAAEQAKEADYLRAGLLLAAGKTDAAADIYDALDDYRDSKTQRKACDYAAASQLIESGDYDGALALFVELGDYEDAADMAKECVLRPAKEALAAGDADTAIELLGTIPGYADADDVMAQAQYARGLSLEESGDLAAAGEAFLQAGAYEDASERAVTALLAAGETAEEAGDYALARGLYGKIRQSEGVEDKYRTATYALAESMLRDKEYDTAAALYNELPEDYEDVLEMRQECVYRPALASLNSREWQAAVDGFSSIPTYRDSADRLERARYGLAASLASAGDYAGAIAQYELLGTYRDSEKLLRTARYDQATAYLAAEDWSNAVTAWETLGTYKDSADRLKQAKYGLALSLMEAGSYAEARALLVSLGRYSDAEQQITACDYHLAEAAESEGRHEDAVALYRSVGSYGDAEERANAICYTMAETALGEGRTLSAGRLFTQAGTYSDATQQAEACYDAYYGKAAESAATVREAGDLAAVVSLLDQVDLSDVPEKYAYLKEWWEDAAYRVAVQLFNDSKPFEALPYFRRIPDYKNVTSNYMQKTVYLLLGVWTNSDGSGTDTYIFYPDGTCSLNGEKLAFTADTYTLFTGADAEHVKLTHRISSITATNMVMRDERNGSRFLRLMRTGDAEIRTTPTPAPTDEPTESPAPEGSAGYLVSDDEDEN